MNEESDKISWKQHSIGFGVFIYILNAFVIPFFSDQEITVKSASYLIIPCLIAGFAFGRFKKWQKERKS